MNKKIEKELQSLWAKVGLIVNLSQMVEYNLANILAFDEILREFETTDSMFVFEYNEFVEYANNWYKFLSGEEPPTPEPPEPTPTKKSMPIYFYPCVRYC